MEVIEYLGFAYGVFVVMIGLELGYSVWRKDGNYRFAEAVANLAQGIAFQTFEFFTAPLVAVPAALVATHLAPYTLPSDEVWAWVVAFLIYEFCVYWTHRFGHTMNFFWGSHAAHHASEDYNLAAALRQPIFQSVINWPFLLPAALLGLSADMLVVLSVVSFLYQFWIHTRYVGRLGPLDWLLSTPSNHRVHHGREAKYLDKNYGAILMIFDHLFGTYQREEEEPGYGLVEPIGSWNPLWGNVFLWLRTWREAVAATRWSDKLTIWFRDPTWVAEGVERPEKRRALDMDGKRRLRAEEQTIPGRISAYVCAHGCLAVALLVALIYLGPTWPWLVSAGLAIYIVAGLLSGGGLLEGKRWAQPLEIARNLASIPLLALMLEAPLPLIVAAGITLSALALVLARPPTSQQVNTTSPRPGT